MDVQESIEGYRLGELLHSGALSTIYRITASGESRPAFPAIIKLPRISAGDGGQGILGFETEARVLPALSGPHVPRFVAAGDIARKPYLVLEWVEGESLERIMERGPLQPQRAAELGAAVADALHSVHAQGAIHFDLKPQNVIIRPSGEAVLIDFGMAQHARYPDLLAEERRFAGGSAPYISPEQVLGSRLDPRSDLFSLGVVLYEMTTGHLPFGAPVTLAGLRDRIWLDPVPPRGLAPDVPPWLQEVTLRCLEPIARKRYQSAAHVAFDLRNPAHVVLTQRASKLRRAGLLALARRWWDARSPQLEDEARPAPVVHAPVVMVAVDTMHPDDARHPALRQAAARILSLSSEYRLICVSVVRGEPVVAAPGETGIHLEHLVRLRRWVEGLEVPEGRLSLHVIESLTPSATLLEFARGNNVDLIVLGAPDPSQEALAWWRSVASSVTANATCSVHVVRVP
jgi:eukaryotic-like serine/threonine-protein kinase